MADLVWTVTIKSQRGIGFLGIVMQQLLNWSSPSMLQGSMVKTVTGQNGDTKTATEMARNPNNTYSSSKAYIDCHLRSSTTTTLVVPPVQGDRAFPVAAPRAWNSLPPSLRTVSSLVPFRHQLKTFLFVHSFA